MRTDISQKDLADAEWLLHIWDKGANTIMLAGTEMRQISAITEQSQLNAQLFAITQASPTGILTLWDWIAEAWRATYPAVDLTSLGDGLHWKDTAQAIKVTRKLAILAMIHNKNINTPMQVTTSNAIKKAILRGAPPHLKMS